MEEWQDEPFALIGVNSDKTVERAQQAVANSDLNWRSFQNAPAGAERAISTVWGVRGWPTIFVLDREMKIHYRGNDGAAATRVARGLLDG
ncbi:MAG: hypothetical protein KDE27_25250 [Planctomycetes bacterium]|nr:hypothetical protein [Planctomycetota bacterium]